MELGGGWSNKLKGKAIEGNVLCYCGIPAKISQAWAGKNPGRSFYGCEKYKRGGDCNFFQWFDEEDAFGWQKKALIEARNEIHEKNKTITELKKTISKLRSDLVKK
uniref:GRF-type domain-containing protein n=1 Tax=Brassica campestris TaxID=3711 RepID=M4DLZ0_BRACM